MLDKVSLSQVLTDDFVWYFKEGEDAKGYQIKGVDGVAIVNTTIHLLVESAKRASISLS